MGDIIASAADIALQVFKWTVRISFVVSVIFALLAILNFVYNTLLIGVSANVLTDLLAFLQLWLPFNINTVTVWFATFVSLYLLYQLFVIVNNYLYRIIGRE